MSDRPFDWIKVNSVTRCFRCLRCGREESFPLPSLATEFVLRGETFLEAHAHCQPMTREVTDGPEAA